MRVRGRVSPHEYGINVWANCSQTRHKVYQETLLACFFSAAFLQVEFFVMETSQRQTVLEYFLNSMGNNYVSLGFTSEMGTWNFYDLNNENTFRVRPCVYF